MMIRDPKKSSLLWKLGKWVIAIELATLGASYLGCKKLNEDRDFRFLCKEKCPIILDGYYLITTLGPDGDVKQQDLDVWKKEGKIK